MTTKEFLVKKSLQKTTMCAAILYPDGEIRECVVSHLKTLIEELGVDVWNEIPKDESPLFWLTARTGAVLIDYENQVYSEKLTKDQEFALELLYDAKVLMNNPKNIHWGNDFLGIEKKAKDSGC